MKRLVPTRAKHRLRDALERLDLLVARLSAGGALTASFYYLAFSREFRREHRAVLAGRRRYRESLEDIQVSCALLRRNTHRLEKGLIMRPRRPVFAEDYIEDTVDCLAKAVSSSALCEDEKKWVVDVLTKYFEEVQDTATINRARRAFQAAVPPSDNRPTSIPYLHERLPDASVNIEQLERLFIRRRSVRWFDERPVPVEDIEKAVSLASLAPSACNRQPFTFFVAADRDKAARLASLAGGTGGFAQNIPCTIAVVGNLDAYPKERDRHLIYIDSALASMQLMLAFEALGLSTCPINWPDVDGPERKIAKLLGLEPYQRTVMLIAVGYADPSGGIPYSQKKKPDTLMRWV